MYNSKFYGYVIKNAINSKKTLEKEEPDYQKTGLTGVLNYLYSTNPNKKYFGADSL